MTEPTLTLTYIGGPTLSIEVLGVRFLTDPTFDPAGSAYQDGPVSLTKLRGPALGHDDVGPIDAVLLSHDQHADNLDTTGRAALSQAGRVLTTSQGAMRLGGKAEGMEPWTATTVGPVTITALPARHGPDGTEEMTGPVIGFLLTWPGQVGGGLYITGDTVPFAGLEAIPTRLDVGVVVAHLGHVQVEPLGEARLSMSAAEALALSRRFGAQTLVPVHYEDWAHFREGGEEARSALSEPGGLRVVWLERGVATVL